MTVVTILSDAMNTVCRYKCTGMTAYTVSGTGIGNLSVILIQMAGLEVGVSGMTGGTVTTVSTID
jgi:hypothetical protein